MPKIKKLQKVWLAWIYDMSRSMAPSQPDQPGYDDTGWFVVSAYLDPDDARAWASQDPETRRTTWVRCL